MDFYRFSEKEFIIIFIFFLVIPVLIVRMLIDFIYINIGSHFMERAMKVLAVIGILVVVFILLVIVQMVNKYSESKYQYEIFNWGNFTLSVVGYIMIFFGNEWYIKALARGGDILNGQLLMGIGVIVILIVVYSNIKNTSLVFGVLITIFQQLLYIPLSVFAFLGVLLALAMASGTKPVYKIN